MNQTNRLGFLNETGGMSMQGSMLKSHIENTRYPSGMNSSFGGVSNISGSRNGAGFINPSFQNSVDLKNGVANIMGGGLLNSIPNTPQNMKMLE